MKVIYIASPYTIGDIAQNVAIQQEYAHKVLDIGHCPIAPILSHYLHIYRQRPWEDWVSMDLAIIPRVDIILRLSGYSKGADLEIEKAIEYGIPVAFGWEHLINILNSDLNLKAYEDAKS